MRFFCSPVFLYLPLCSLLACAPGDDGGPPDSNLEQSVDVVSPDLEPAGPCQGASSSRLDLNDVSFLFPLPASPAEQADLLGPNDEGAHGPLLPVALHSKLPTPLARFPERLSYEHVRVVAARVDPCFPTNPPPSGAACRRQLRLVAQPLWSDGSQLSTADATVHLFYELSPKAFDALRARLALLKADAAGSRTFCKPLGVHPVMAEEGLDGQYAAMLKALILEFVGRDNLVRVATMTLGRPGSVWNFQTADVNGSAVTPVPIPRLADAATQAFIVSDTEVNAAVLGPEPLASGIPLLFKPQGLAAADGAVFRASLEETLAVENPRLEHADSIDCVSCHVAGRARFTALSQRQLDVAGSPKAYVNAAFDLTVPEEDFARDSQRAFGYFDTRPSFTARVVHESAEVAQMLNDWK